VKHVVVRGEPKPGHRQEAIRIMAGGGVVLLPCGENYLLVSRSEDRLAPFGYSLRQRLVRDRAEFDALLAAPSMDIRRLADAFLPGDLTLVVGTEHDRTGVMMPRTGFLAGLLSESAEPLHFQEVLDCDSGQDLQDAYRDRVDLWLDAGGVRLTPSTLLDVTGRRPIMNRKGAIPILDIERVLGDRLKLGPAVVFAVLFVCTGNTCRSAMARGILEQRLRGQRALVYSAGTNTVAGMPASEGATQVMRENGIDLSRHSSTPLTASQVRDADLILCMEPRHRRRVLELVPEAESRTFLQMDYCGHAESVEVFDPVGSSLEVFREVAKIIAECLEKVAQDIEWRLAPEQ